MEHKLISSPANAVIKEAVRIRDGQSRRTEIEFFIEGPHLLEAAFPAKAISIRQLFYTGSFAGSSDGTVLLKRMADFLPPGAVFAVSDGVMAKLSDTKTPQGIAAIVSTPPLVMDDINLASVPLLIACDRIQDPGNMGTIIRLADAVGTDAVIVFPGCCNPFMPKAVRSSAGSIFHMPVVAAEVRDAAEYCRQREIALVAADVHAEQDCFAADFRRPLAIVFGNEAHGISRGMKEYISETVRIPIIGQAESLNVAMSAAVLMYEAVRQRTEKLHGR